MYLASTLLLGSLVVVPSAPGWAPCPGDDVPAGLVCASVDVPVDWARPDGRRITLQIAKLPATGARTGTVFAVPGGPGGSGVDDLKYRVKSFDNLRGRFDVVSLTPRTHASAGGLPVECFTTGPWLTRPDGKADYARLAVANRASAERCRRHDPELFDHLDSASFARDIDAVRAALGERRLSFIATSYGGVPAVAYARLFPERVRAMYLDGAVNQLRDTRAEMRDRAATYEKQFTRFAAWCAADASCALHGPDPAARWRKLVARADRDPVPVSGERVRYSGFDMQIAAMPNLVHPGTGNARWAQLAAAAARAEAGDARGFADYVKASGSLKPPSYTGMNATHCADGLRFAGYADYRGALAIGRRLSPNLPDMGVWHRLGCAGWPGRVANPPSPLPSSGLPPFLGAGTWTDYADTADLALRVPGSSTVRYDGPGHGLYLTGNACVIAHADRYLTDLTLPPPGTVCR
ncbi:alpha/beta fold hydrolase [Nonomuraea sp. SBT364]|uniref:alpha/beta fold hydrolase n=1 Tax=Nonomuraea sp. SBT364 TaxID=1580530 RepID=UPI00069F5477|nr:alpha/beta fold hydrolase [Nonomuraea sp. SBT364]